MSGLGRNRCEFDFLTLQERCIDVENLLCPSRLRDYVSYTVARAFKLGWP